MIRPRWLALLSLLAAWPVAAHHSVVSEYDTSKTIAYSGHVKSLQLGNPHSYLVVEVARPGGPDLVLRGEMASAGLLKRAGWTPQSLAVGEHVRLTGSPGRHSDTDFYIISVTRDDGSQLPLIPAT